MPPNGFIYEARMDMMENSGHCVHNIYWGTSVHDDDDDVMPRPRPRLVTVTVSRTECSRSLVIMSVMRIQGHRLLLPTINNINIRYNPCFIFAFTSDGGVNVLRKLNESISAAAGYMCRSVLGSPLLSPCSQPRFMKSSPSRSDWVMKSEHDHAIIRTQYFSILFAGLYSWSIKPFWDI